MSEELIKRLRDCSEDLWEGEKGWPGHYLEAADTIEALTARIAQLEAELAGAREDMAMCVAEMAKARGRLESVASHNFDRQIAAALGSTCDHIRRRWFTAQERTDD